MRKKYIYNQAQDEINFLTEFYRDLNSKRGRTIAFKIDSIEKRLFHEYLDDFIILKAKQHQILVLKFSIKECELKLQVLKVQ